MKISASPVAKTLKYLVWPGISLFFVGLSTGIVSGQWGAVPMVLMILGLALIAFWVLLQVTAQNFWMKRSTQIGTNALIATVAMLIVLGLLNVLAARFPQRLDLTENQLYSLAPQSLAVLKGLDKPAQVYVFSSLEQPQAESLLSNYARSENFAYEWVNPTQEPGLAAAFSPKDEGDLYVKLGDRQQFVQNVLRDPLTESKLTSTLQQLKSDRTDSLYYLQGHGEHGPEALSRALELLEGRNFVAEPLNLAQRINTGEGLPEDASVILVAGPQRELFKQEVDALKKFLQSGGGLLLLIDPNTNPKLDSLLSPWGVQLDDRLVIDGASGGGVGGVVGLGPTSPLVTRYGAHPITESFDNGISFYPLSRAIELKEREGIDAVPLLLTNDASWAEKDLESQVQFDEKRDLQGPLTLGVALSKPAEGSQSSDTTQEEQDEAEQDEAEQPNGEQGGSQPGDESRLVVIGNASFVTNGPVDQQLNPDVFLNAVSWLSERKNDVLSISPKEATNRQIILGSIKANAVAFCAVVLLPLFGFGTAGWLWWQQR